MPNIPGATNALPGVFTDIVTQSRGTSVPGGSRVVAIIGEGSTDEVIVSQAVGGGLDGLNSSYSSASNADGRHFQLANAPFVSNRTTVFKNGAPLVGLEQTIDTNPFSNRYDYRVDITTGKIELQTAHIFNQGGANYVPLATNVGDGYISPLTLIDANAPPETWTIRCISVQRGPGGAVIAGTAKFMAFGSVSGVKLDKNGNQIIWKATGKVADNTILEFGIYETVGSTPFKEGDAFTVIIASGVLVKGDSLTANYVSLAALNDPLTLLGMDEVVARHGSASLDNNLSLGAQLAFANSAPSIISVQAAPAMPRRTSLVLETSVNAESTNDDDFIFPLPIGMVPEPNSEIHFFLTDNATNQESQILPNKLDYYLIGTSGHPTVHEFITDNTEFPGNSYAYTVIKDHEVMASGFDGYVGRDLSTNNKGVFSSSIYFDSSYLGLTLKLIDATNTANIGEYIVDAVSGGKLYVTRSEASPYFPDFTTEDADVAFQIINVATGSPLVGGEAIDGYVTKLVATATGTFGSLSIDFSAFGTITTRRLQINGSLTNNGLYDITAFDSLTNTITISKAVVNESNMRYEVLDMAPSAESTYIVINKNMIPTGTSTTYQLRANVLDLRDASFYDAGWINALTSLEVVECDIVVPLPKQTISVIFQNTLSHCKTMSNIKMRKERVLFCGAIRGLTPDNVTGASPAAVEDIGVLEGIQGDIQAEVNAGNIEDLANYDVQNAFGNTFRCVYFYPDEIVVQAGADNLLIDGFYIAAAAGGYCAADVRIENPLTNKSFSGFSILRNKQFSPKILERLAAKGICVLQPISGGGRVVWGITTSDSGYAEEQEISVVFIRDQVGKVLRNGFQSFIGKAESSNTALDLQVRAVSLLNSLSGQGLITTYQDLVIKRDSVDPRQWNVSVRVQPTYPINWIYIKVELGLL